MDTAARRREEIAELGLLERSIPDAVGHLLDAARLLTGAKDAQLNVLTDDRQVTLVDASGGTTSASLPDSVCARVIDGPDDEVQIPDATQDPRYADVGIVARGDLVGYAASKLVTSTGVVIGTVCVFSDERLEMAPHLVEALHQVGLSAMAALEAGRQRRTAEDALAVSRSRAADLERTNDHLGAFAGQVAHDLRGPLATIVFALGLLRDDPLPLESRHLLDRAVSSTLRLQRTVSALLELALLGGHADHVDVVLDDMVGEVLHDLVASRGRTEVEVLALPVVAGLPELLRAVLLNLIGNAYKYAGGVDLPLVRVSGSRDDDLWRLVVEDNGPGVAVDQREAVFEPMRRGDGAGAIDRDGLGIGLATCRRVAQVHGGRIGVDESPLGGARFFLEVPVGAPGTPVGAAAAH